MEFSKNCAVKKLSATEMPQRLIYAALYNARFGGSLPEEQEGEPTQYSEDSCGHYIAEHYLQSSNRIPSWSAYSPLEHPVISFEIHADIATLYELAAETKLITFTNQSLGEVAEGTQLAITEKSTDLEDLFSARPPGNYPDHTGHRHPWTEEDRQEQLAFGLSTAFDIKSRKEIGVGSHHTSQWLTTNTLQKSVASGSLRSWLQLLDSHSRPHKSYEMQDLVSKIADHINSWIPQVYTWWSTQHRSKLDLRV